MITLIFRTKSRFGQHQVSALLRDFQRHSAVSATSALTSGRGQSESHARLLEADTDDDYGALYIAEEDENKTNYYDINGRSIPNGQVSDFCDSDVPGPAPEVEPPRPAPSSVDTSRMFYYDQQVTGVTGFGNQPVTDRDLNDNFSDNQHVQPHQPSQPSQHTVVQI